MRYLTQLEVVGGCNLALIYGSAVWGRFVCSRTGSGQHGMQDSPGRVDATCLFFGRYGYDLWHDCCCSPSSKLVPYVVVYILRPKTNQKTLLGVKVQKYQNKVFLKPFYFFLGYRNNNLFDLKGVPL